MSKLAACLLVVREIEAHIDRGESEKAQRLIGEHLSRCAPCRELMIRELGRVKVATLVTLSARGEKIMRAILATEGKRKRGEPS